MVYEKTEKLLSRLNYGRVFLFLGFDYLLDTFPFNPVLKIISEDIDVSVSSFDELYKISDKFSSGTKFNVVKNNLDQIPTNNAITPLSRVNWNAIYTSSIDDLLLTRMKGGIRTTKPICKSKASNNYSRNELNINFLYGLYSRIDKSERVPANRQELLIRNNESLLMLNHLIDSMTPMDTLLISGWNCSTDPVSPENFYQVLSKLSKDQVFIFGEKESYNDELINILIDNEIICPVNISLSSFLDSESDSLEYSIDTDSEFDSFIRILNKPVAIPSKIKRLINYHGHIVEDQDFYGVSKNVETSDIYQEFLFESSRTPVWKAYPNKLDFERDYFSSLFDLVQSEIKKNKVSTSPIILHGATGTGKSVSLGKLCFELYKQQKYLILHISNSKDSLDFRVIDELCEWAETSANLSTVICWDGMSSIESYRNLSAFLSSRGRKQIIVGTSYKLEDKHSKYHIASQEKFSKRENQSFIKYLRNHDINIKIGQDRADSAFLVTLYRLLPETRFSLATGVVNEARFTKKFINNTISVSDSPCENIITEAFRKVLNADSTNIIFNTEDSNNVSINNIIDTVMIVGKFGIDTPFDILMRMHPRLRFSNISDVFKKIDIIRWYENSYGDIYLSPRNTLEAEIYCKRIFSNKNDHVNKLLDVIGSVEQKRVYNCIEIKFCSDVVRAFGPNGPSGKEYQDSYLMISDAIGALISSKRIDSSILRLHKANLAREYGRRKYSDENVYYKEYYDILLDALDMIESAIEKEEKRKNKEASKRYSGFSLIPLYGEKTAILGTLANQIRNKGGNESQESLFINEALDTVKESFKYDISNYISLDAITWIVLNPFKLKKQVSADKLKLLVDAVALFNEYSKDDFDERYQKDFLKRKAELYSQLGNEDITNKTLDELKKVSLEDYHYYKLSKIIMKLNVSDNLSEKDKFSLRKAIDYMDRNYEESMSSYKISVLYLRLFWLYENGSPLLKGERIPIKKSNDFWNKVLDVTDNILSLSYNNNLIIYNFVRAVAFFHIGRYEESEDIFKLLSRESESISGSRRVFKSIIMSDENGIRKFSGEITKINAMRNRGEIYIDELKTKVVIFPSDFGLNDDDRGNVIHDFHIAFNFLSALADNEKFFKVSEK